MKISLRWLADYLPGPLDPEKAADALTHGGLPSESIETVGGDTVIDVEVTSNRSDCLSHLGVARELSALLDRPFKGVDPVASESADATAAQLAVRIDAWDLCPRYVARVIRGVRIGPSPAWMQERLTAVGVRPINNVVDVTNFVLFELGQPLHAFDFDKLAGGQIIVRQAHAGERMITLDRRDRELSPDMLVIADAHKPAAIAGVMGGRDSEVSDGTVNVLIESARFDPLSIRKTARGLAMGSDSSYRFERGIDPMLQERAALRAAQLIMETAGGELLHGAVSAGAEPDGPAPLTLRLSKLKSVLGIDLSPEEVVDALRRDHLEPAPDEERVYCTIPSYRLDLKLEIDLVEETARVVGYDRVPTHDEIAIRLARPDPAAAAFSEVRSALTAGGYFESVTFSFVSDLLAMDFVPADAAAQAPLLRAQHQVRKADANLRPSILPGLLESIRHNESVAVESPRLFETGSVFWRSADARPVESKMLALVGGSLREARGAVESLLERLDPNRAMSITPGARGGFARGACGMVSWGGQMIGHLGRIDRAIADKLGLRDIPAAAELQLAPLLAGMQHVPQLRPLPKYPAVRRDLSLVMPESTRYEKVEALVAEQHLANLEAVQYVTSYRGKPLEAGTKSVTLTLVFRSSSQTLTSEAVDASVQRVIDAAKGQGWTQRA